MQMDSGLEIAGMTRNFCLCGWTLINLEIRDFFKDDCRTPDAGIPLLVVDAQLLESAPWKIIAKIIHSLEAGHKVVDFVPNSSTFIKFQLRQLPLGLSDWPNAYLRYQ